MWFKPRSVVFIGLAVACLGCPDGASAHAKLKLASPAANATVKSAVTDIKLQFNEAVEPSFSVIGLLDASGKQLATSKGSTFCEKTNCTFTVAPLKPGSYEVKYHVLSADGHVVEGTYAFKVAD